MKKILASFLSVLMVLTCIIIPGMVVSAATPEYLDHYNFSVKEGEIFEYQYGSKNTGKVTFDPGAGRISRDIYPFYNPANVTGNGNTGLTAGYEALDIDGVTYDSIGIYFKNATCFTPMMEDGKPFELAPGKTYTVDISYAVTRNDGTKGASNYYFCAVGGLMLPCYGTQPEYLTSSIPAWESPLGTPFKADHNETIPLQSKVTGELKHTTFTFTTKGAPADGDTSYTYDAAENTYTVTANSAADGTGTDSEVEISNYLQIFFRGTGPVEINFTHLEITSEDYVPETTVEYVVDGTVVKSETVAQGTEYAINYVPANTATERFSGWYTDEEMTSYIGDNGAVTAGNDTIRYYGKMLPYENSVTNTLNTAYYNSGNYPSFVNSVYQGTFTSRSNYANGLTSTENDITIVPTQWRSTLIMPAINKTTGDYFVVQSGAEYKVSLTYKINYSEESTSTPKFRVRAGYGVDTTKQIWSSAGFLSGGAYEVRDEAIVEGQGEVATFTQNLVIEETDGYPFIGVEVFVRNTSSVTFYEMKVEKIQSEDLSTGEFLVTDSAENRTTYKVEFEYKLNEELTEDIGIGFKTIAENDIGHLTFVEGEDVAIYNISADKEVGEWIPATAFVTTDMTADVQVNEGTDDDLTALNSKLYAYIIGEDNYSKISVKEGVVATALGDVVGKGKDYYLAEEAETVSGSQALRYSFTYESTTGSDIIIDGETYTVKSRGFIYLDGKGYALNDIYAGDINLTNAKAKDQIAYDEKSTELEKCWDYIGTTLYYSTYIYGFDANDTKELMVRGFITIECEGQTFTLYSDTFNRSVAYMKSLQTN